MSDGSSNQAHIDRIREALWCSGAHGRAAVMVGAGFSRNARPISPSTPAFPTWGELAMRLAEALDPQQVAEFWARDQDLARRVFASQVLGLAQQYEASFSRGALDRLVIEAVPDAGHEPGPLHERLLALPWADVFTTNYDTLLERAAARVVERKYEVVRHAAEVPGAARPRIVKLHGILPATRPFILTEEDFRTYPRRFAPLVNLVQQAMLEHVLCLVGFSGDDPNFLAWAGWIRDNLGPSASPIYLCGLLGLSHAQRDLLRARNIVPLDLDPLVPRDRFPEPGARHALALEWLLGNLEAGRPPNPRRWPRLHTRSGPDAPVNLPQFPPDRSPKTTDEERSPSDSVDAARVGEEVSAWATNRHRYPGWLIAPDDVRESVWQHTQPWILPLLRNLEEVDLGRRLAWLSELNWRFELCLVPLFDEVKRAIRILLDQLDPFPDLNLDLQAGTSRTGLTDAPVPDWAAARESWIELGFALLRAARERQDMNAFALWADRLEKIAEGRPSLRTRLRYEQCLLGLVRLDHAGVRKHLAHWPIHEDSDPFWLVRRAAVHAEVGDTAEAERLVEVGLASIRARTRPGNHDLAMLSREAWAIKLHEGLKFVRWLERREPWPAYESSLQTERKETLASLGCDPDSELRLLELKLNQSPSRGNRESEERPAFDPGRVIREGLSFHLYEWYEVVGPALQLIRLIEVAAYPPQCVDVRMSQDELLGAARRLESSAPQTSINILLRITNERKAGDFFSRAVVASLPDEQVQALEALLTEALDHALPVVSSTTPMIAESHREIAIDQARIAFQLLSRLALRLDPERLERLSERALVAYHSPAVRRDWRLSEDLATLFGRVFQAMSRRASGSLLPRLAALPVVGADFEVSRSTRWIDPIQQLPDEAVPPQRAADERGWDRTVGRLLELADAGDEARRRAILRLHRLLQFDLLSPEEARLFGLALWSRIDGATGLPAASGLNIRGLLSSPDGGRGQSRRVIRRYCLAHDHGVGTKGLERLLRSAAMAAPPVRAERGGRAGRHIRWSENELERFLARIEAWWAQESNRPKPSPARRFFGPTALETLVPIFDFFRFVLIPRCKPDGSLAARVIALVTQFEASGLPTEFIRPFLIRHDPDSRAATTAMIRRGLAARDRERFESSLVGLFLWATNSDRLGIGTPPEELLYELGVRIGGRIPASLDRALLYMKQIVAEAPHLVSPALAEQLTLGLEYLAEEALYRPKEEAANTPIPYDLIPVCRRHCAGLARALAATIHGDSEVIRRWLEEARRDVLPEVRREVDADL